MIILYTFNGLRADPTRFTQIQRTLLLGAKV